MCCCCCLVTQSCPTLCDSMDCSPSGSSVHGILQARVLEWVAMPSSRGSSQPRDRTWVFYIAGRFFTTELPGKPHTYILLLYKIDNHKDILYSAGNSTRYFIINSMRKESEKECIYMCVCVCTFFLVPQLCLTICDLKDSK